ncbi:ankyrin repeat-containing protein NPR4-like [Zingiber officinale]|uniref:ankyrin repeat-containing protein NPR4-like n=1 Tax=Zingiber officinale TaxID=94328 RepID=UPI001C4DC6C0|nr:ankyrin repeat-containing protein NPR4-like [Zingiber officinale]
MAVTGTNCEVVKALVDADLAIVMLPDREALLGKDPHLARRTDKKGHMAVTGTNCEVVKALVDADLAIVMLPDRGTL